MTLLIEEVGQECNQRWSRDAGPRTLLSGGGRRLCRTPNVVNGCIGDSTTASALSCPVLPRLVYNKYALVMYTYIHV